jgi:hypothetical protein
VTDALPPKKLDQQASVVNVRHHAFDQYIGRIHPRFPDGSLFGNPYAVEPHGREVAISMYTVYFKRRLQTDPAFKFHVDLLRGKKLGCWCAPAACHGDVIATYVNSLPAPALEDLT